MTDTTVVKVILPPDSTTVKVIESDATVVNVSDTKTVVVAAAAIGPRGIQGPPGAVSSTYLHPQVTPLSVWTIQHNLGVNPGGITVLDETGRLVLGWTANHASTNVLVLSFPSPESGTAYIS